MSRPFIALAAHFLIAAFSVEAAAQVYKYTKPDGTVVYTDKLSDLPADRRAHYNREAKEAEQRRKAQVNMLGEAEVKRREAEAARQRLERAQLDEAERARRMAEIDAALERIERDRERTAGNKKAWQDRVKKAKAELKEALQSFRETKKAYSAIAIKPAFSRFPGESEKAGKLKAKLDALERRVDAAIRELYVVIPEEARKKGVPPGWVR